MRKCVAVVLLGVVCLGCTDEDQGRKHNERPSLLPGQTNAQPKPPAPRPPSGTAPKIRIGHDTTRITAPLKADGTPDYIAALNERHARGVTPKNNAVVLILQAVGPEAVIEHSIRAATLEAIGYEPPDEERYFLDFPRGQEDPAYELTMKNLWQRADYPAVAKWLDDNKAPLDLLVAASSRTRFYMPVPTSPDRPFWGLAMLDQLSWKELMLGTEALIARANLAAGEGRIKQAWQDILVAYRLGILMGQDSSLVGHLVGTGRGKMASDATIGLATSGRLSAAQAKAILADLQALGPLPDIVTTIDRFDRYGILDLVIWFQRDPALAFSALDMAPADRDRRALERLLGQADFNDILRRANVYFDTLAAAMRKETFLGRNNAYMDILERMLNLKAEGRILAEKKLRPPFETPLTTREAGTMLLIPVLFTPDRAKDIADAGSVRRDLATVALALAAHRAEKGSYPARLSALAPEYLQAVPDDFCGGRPFIYRRLGEGYLLYSVGWNIRDDGGVGWTEQDPDKDDIAARAQR